MIWLRRIWVLSIGGLIFQALYYWPRLPEHMASHFDEAGTADGYASRSAFMLLWFVALTLVNIWPIVLGPLMRKFPARLINVPHKDYWLAAPKRRDRMIDIIRNMIAGALLGANLILGLAFHYTVNYNIGDRDMSISAVWIAVIAETLLSLLAIAWGLIKLSNPPAEHSGVPLS